MVGFIIFIVIGGIIGWLASLVMGTNAQMGLIANILVGIVGAALGGWLAPKLGIAASGFMVYLVAVGGAVLLIFLLKLVGVFK